MTSAEHHQIELKPLHYQVNVYRTFGISPPHEPIKGYILCYILNTRPHAWIFPHIATFLADLFPPQPSEIALVVYEVGSPQPVAMDLDGSDD